MSRRMLLPALLLAALLAAAPADPASAARRGSCTLQAGSPRCHVWTGKVTFVADGDTIDVDIAGDGTRAPRRVRLTGLQAMEQSVYSSRASRRRGECHALAATARLEQLLRRGRMRVRLAAQQPASRAGSRLRRSAAVRRTGTWRDVGRTLLAEGHALWLPDGREFAWNRDYGTLQAGARSAGRNLWDPDGCSPGPGDGRPIGLLVNWHAETADPLEPNGEWVRIANRDPARPLPLGGWYLRDSGPSRLVFPDHAAIPPDGSITVYNGIGADTETTFHRGLRNPAFDDITHDGRAMGDGAYLFDPDGDMRASMVYPCRDRCDDPARGVLQLSAQARGAESLQIRNSGAAPIDLEPYRLVTGSNGYSFDPRSVLGAGETMRVRLYATGEEDSRLIRHWPVGGPILADGGDVVDLRRYDDVVVACTAWGDLSC